MVAPLLAGPAAWLAGGGMALSGLGSVIGAFGGGGGGAGGGDFSGLYSQLLSQNTPLTIAGQELATLMAPYVEAERYQTLALGKSAYDQFDVAKQKEQTLSGLQAGIASQLASSSIGLGDLAKKGEIATQMLGPETASALTKQYALGVQELATEGLKGQTTLLTPAATALATMATEAQRTSNKLASDIASTNLDIRRQQEQTRNQLALQRGQVEGQLAIKRFGAGMALAGQRAFA